jgi:hypothetical protein
VESMREVGYATASADDFVRMRIHRVDAQFVRHGREDGFALLTPAEAVRLSIRGPRGMRPR